MKTSSAVGHFIIRGNGTGLLDNGDAFISQRLTGPDAHVTRANIAGRFSRLRNGRWNVCGKFSSEICTAVYLRMILRSQNVDFFGKEMVQFCLEL